MVKTRIALAGSAEARSQAVLASPQRVLFYDTEAKFWGQVCAFEWQTIDGTVACKELAPQPTPEQEKMGSVSALLDGDNAVTWISGVSCAAGMDALEDCPKTPASACFGRYAAVRCIEKSK